MSEARLTRLANGLAVVSQAMPGVETAAIGLHADVGSRHEPAAVNGVAHLLEHMVFKGTLTRSARGIAEAIEDVGGQLNAYTARDATVFHARTLGEDVPLALDLIADLVREPRFDADDLERERQVVLAELGEARDTPDDIVFDHLQAAAFPDQPLGRSILGDEGTIGAIDEAALRGWLDVHYRGPALVVAAAGKVDHDAIVAQAERRLGDLPAGRGPVAAPARFEAQVHHDRRRFEQAHLTLGWCGAGVREAGVHALNLFVAAAGGGMSSRLFQQMREERGLAYSVYATTTAYEETGLVSVYLATATREAAGALELAESILHDCAATLDEAELARAKAQVRAGFLMALEGCEGVASQLARGLMVEGRIVPAAEIVARYEAVTVDEARAAGARMLAQAPARAAVGAARLRLAA